jgi:HK97 family phage prohead protease
VGEQVIREEAMERRLSKVSAVDREGKTLRGKAVVYNSDSEDLGGFIERVHPQAFKRTLSDTAHEIRSFWNHDSRLLLGRRSNGTLQLDNQSDALVVEISMPDTGFARDLAALVARGDCDAMSFGFTLPGGKSEAWEPHESNPRLKRRTLLDCTLHEISVVSVPAYPETSVAIRSMADWARKRDKDRLRLLSLLVGFPK